MKKHLQFIDGNTDKFWQIEIAGSTYTVTYGRNGTNGVSLQKTFDSVEACHQSAEKLTAEKIKKGYSEDGQITNSAVKVSRKVSAQEAIEALDEIIKYKQEAALLPFLQEKSKGHVSALKKHIKKCRRYWMEFMNFRKEPEFRHGRTADYGRRGSDVQCRIVTLSAIALFDKTDIASWSEALPLLNDTNNEILVHIIQWAKPSWLGSYFLSEIIKQNWTIVDYTALRYWERQNILEYNPELYALCIARFNDYDYTRQERRNTRQYMALILQDSVAYERDVPLLFNYETPLHTQTFKDNETDKHSFVLWEILFPRLLAENKIERTFFIEQSLQIQTKDWNNNLKSFFRKQIEALDPTVEELSTQQETLFTYLHAPNTAVVNFGLGLIKKIADRPDFHADSFLEWVEPMMMRNDCKPGVKALFPVLEKLNKNAPRLGPQIAALLAGVFAIDDLSLQEKAAKILLKIAGTPNEELKDKLLQFAPFMQGNVKSLLGTIWETNTALDTKSETYVQIAQEPDLLNEAVILPATWNDIIFQFGNFINSDEVLDAEILLNVFICQRHLFPADYRNQLDPYVKQMQGQHFSALYKNHVRDFLIAKTVRFNQLITSKYHYSNKLFSLATINKLIDKTEEKLNCLSTLPLLSFPTHKPCWVAPRALLERLLAYQNNGEKIDMVDLTIAISRMPRPQVPEAFPLLAGLTGWIKPFMEFCLGHSHTIELQEHSMISKLITFVSGKGDVSVNHALWAVAARTYYPSETFYIFEKTSLQTLPFVVSPPTTQISFKERWHKQYNYQLRKYERVFGSYELNVDYISAFGPIPQNLLYSIDIKKEKITWNFDLFIKANVYHLHSITPQNPEPLAILMLQAACANTNGSSDGLEAYLDITDRPEFWFSENSMLVFACCFFHEKKNTRLMATEVLINHIQRRTINPEKFGATIARLISEKYGVVLRVVDSLAAVKDVSALHNSALQAILDNIFKQVKIKEKMPVNFKKLVEHYLDLLYKTRQPPSPETRKFFERWQENNAMKVLAKKIIGF